MVTKRWLCKYIHEIKSLQAYFKLFLVFIAILAVQSASTVDGGILKIIDYRFFVAIPVFAKSTPILYLRICNL